MHDYSNYRLGNQYFGKYCKVTPCINGESHLKQGLITTEKMEFILDTEYSQIEIRYVSNFGHVFLCRDYYTNKFGVIGYNKKELIEFIYDEIDYLENDNVSGRYVSLTKGIKDARMGIYDLYKMKLVVPIKYDCVKVCYLFPNSTDECVVFMAGKYIDKKTIKYTVFNHDGKKNLTMRTK